ncbi:MAG: [FeFe] hydrogenase H-cluster radical SAM maturase HydE [Alkalispirochaeta sp.]
MTHAHAIDSREVAAWLKGAYPGGDAALFAQARLVQDELVGPEVRLRGLLEVSNYCGCDCLYCGIRRNAAVPRFDLSDADIGAAADQCVAAGFGSMTVQAGERRDQAFVERVTGIVTAIKERTRSERLPEGLGITLSVGEQSTSVYSQWRAAGAHRYLLRIETSDPDLFARLHPARQRYETRVAALRSLKATGFQLGTGVMIGIPGQSEEQLAADIIFFRDVDADMIGMGPYIPSRAAMFAPVSADGGGAPPSADVLTPDRSPRERLRLTLRMIAATRIVLGDVNIAATTALQALSATGREAGLRAGANVLMPIVTPVQARGGYQLYDGKPCVDEESAACAACTPWRAARAGRPVIRDAWGDAPHATTSAYRKGDQS